MQRYTSKATSINSTKAPADYKAAYIRGTCEVMGWMECNNRAAYSRILWTEQSRIHEFIRRSQR